MMADFVDQYVAHNVGRRLARGAAIFQNRRPVKKNAVYIGGRAAGALLVQRKALVKSQKIKGIVHIQVRQDLRPGEIGDVKNHLAHILAKACGDAGKSRLGHGENGIFAGLNILNLIHLLNLVRAAAFAKFD